MADKLTLVKATRSFTDDDGNLRQYEGYYLRVMTEFGEMEFKVQTKGPNDKQVLDKYAQPGK